MKKKLGISLREPVKIYREDQSEKSATTEQSNRDRESEIKSSDLQNSDSEKIKSEKEIPKILKLASPENSQTTNENSKNANKTEELIEKQAAEQTNFQHDLKFIGSFSEVTKKRIPHTVELMSERTFEIWKCLLNQAAEAGQINHSFIVTRARVMHEAKVGSTNTYRLALIKLQDLGLLKIELRPGVTSGSVFHLTKEGINLAQALIEDQLK